MIRSRFAITRLIVVPYVALLLLYFLVIGFGGGWLFFNVRAVESRLLIDQLLEDLNPLAERLAKTDSGVFIDSGNASLDDLIRKVFAEHPALRGVFLRDSELGVEMNVTATGEISNHTAAPLSQYRPRTDTDLPAEKRLHAETDPLFLLRFDLISAQERPVQMEFSFDRAALLTRVDKGLAAIMRAIVWFGLAGGVSIFVALVITLIAMRKTQQIESHFQEIYRRAAMTDIASELVHDLRNPLMALRANVRALLLSPDQTREIVNELDRDIISLNDKLSGFLKLTRSHEDTFVSTDIGVLLRDAARIAEPVLAEHGLTLQLDIAENLPMLQLQKVALRDALLNVIINAAQSGQQQGAIEVQVGVKNNAVIIIVQDRGSGIAPEHLPHVFDAFYTTRSEGNGLGLAIVQRIVIAHHGRIHAENREGGGVRIVMLLPLQKQEIPHWWKPLKKNFQI